MFDILKFLLAITERMHRGLNPLGNQRRKLLDNMKQTLGLVLKHNCEFQKK